MSRTASPNRRTARVLMYTAYFDPEYSGAALQALTLARELRQRGHYVEFVTNRWPGLAETGEVEGFFVRRLEPGLWRKHREFRLWFNLSRYVWPSGWVITCTTRRGASRSASCASSRSRARSAQIRCCCCSTSRRRACAIVRSRPSRASCAG